jgi:hypothetical protein
VPLVVVLQASDGKKSRATVAPDIDLGDEVHARWYAVGPLGADARCPGQCLRVLAYDDDGGCGPQSESRQPRSRTYFIGMQVLDGGNSLEPADRPGRQPGNDVTAQDGRRSMPPGLARC